MGSYIFDGTDDKLTVTTAVVTAVPFTVGVWFEANNVTAVQVMLTLGDTAGFAEAFRLIADGVTAGDPVGISSVSGSGTGGASSTTGFSADTWTSAVGVFTSATSRAVFKNGGSKGTNTTSSTPTSIDKLTIGAYGRATDSQWFPGHIGYVFIWNIALSDAEVASWHGGAIPQSGSLVAAYDLTFDHAGPINDAVGSLDLTVAGSTYDGATSPPVSYTIGGTNATVIAVAASVSTAAAVSVPAVTLPAALATSSLAAAVPLPKITVAQALATASAVGVVPAIHASSSIAIGVAPVSVSARVPLPTLVIPMTTGTTSIAGRVPALSTETSQTVAVVLAALTAAASGPLPLVRINISLAAVSLAALAAGLAQRLFPPVATTTTAAVAPTASTLSTLTVLPPRATVTSAGFGALPAISVPITAATVAADGVTLIASPTTTVLSSPAILTSTALAPLPTIDVQTSTGSVAVAGLSLLVLYPNPALTSRVGKTLARNNVSGLTYGVVSSGATSA